jgi:hypothetical protein
MSSIHDYSSAPIQEDQIQSKTSRKKSTTAKSKNTQKHTEEDLLMEGNSFFFRLL